MTLSQRLWWSIAYHCDETSIASCMVWAKVRQFCIGKRHYLRHIPLSPSEEAWVVHLLRNPPDETFRSQINHEARNFPDGWERSLRWLPEGWTP